MNATGVWADRIRPEELHDEAEVPTIRPSRGTHVTLARERLPLEAGAILPAGEGRTIFALPWLGSTLVGHDRQRLRRRHRRRAPAARRRRLSARRRGELLRDGADPRRRHRRLRRRAAADLAHRRQEVGGHLAQGRALRDLERAHHHHRRQADHVAADGQAGRRPPRRARGSRGAVPHARDPAGAVRRRGRAARRSRACPTSRARRWPPATATRPTTCSRSPPSAASSRSRSCPGTPTCSPRPCSRHGASRLAASPTCSCGARGWGCWRRASCRRSGPGAPERVAAALGAERGWDDRRIAAEAQRFREAAREQALFPPTGSRRRRGRDAPTEPGP